VLHLIQRPLITGAARGPILRCWTERFPDAVVLHTEGEVDLTTATALADAIAEASRQNGNGGVIVDLSRLDYLDGSGIRVLEYAAEMHRGRFVVVGSKPAVHALFDILELTEVLPVVPSVEAAVQRLRGS
jgi:anti-sigma B factor antagonist